MKHWLLRIWLPLWSLFLLTSIIAHDSPVHAQIPTTFTVTPAFEGNYVPGAWLPIQIALSNDGPTFTALVTAQLPNTLTSQALSVELPQGSRKDVTLYVAMEQEVRSIQVSLQNPVTGTILQQSVEVRPRVGERLLGVATEQNLVLALPRRQDMRRLPFTTVNLSLANLPDQHLGLSSLTVMLLADGASESLSEAQQQALQGWVARGGHLVIGGGSAAQRTLAGLPETLRVAEIGEPTSLDPDILGALVADDGPDELAGVELQPVPSAARLGPADAPLLVQDAFGKGRITQLAFNPGQEALSEWTAAPTFWDQLLQPSFQATGSFGLETTVDRFQEQSLTSAIGNLPALNLPPGGALFAMLAIYTIVIGPGIAIVLRQMDRQVLGWAIVPIVALVITGIGFGLAFRLRADQRIVSQVGLVEQVGPNHARARLFTGILSPQTENFNIEIAPETLTRPMRSLSSQFGPINGAVGSYLQQTDTFSVTVERWELQGVVAEQQVPFPQLDAQIVLNDDGIQAQVSNTTDQLLRDVLIAFAGQIARIGDIEPGEQGTAQWPVSANPQDDDAAPAGTPLSSLVFDEELEAARRPGNVPARQLLVREALINAAVTRGTQTPDDTPIMLAWLDQSPLNVVVDAPQAATRQTTLLVSRPTMSGNGEVALPRDWLRPDLAADNNTTCSGSGGTGINAQSQAMTVTMRLPPDLAALRTTALTLTLESERTWPNAGVTTELFDWERQRWVDINYDGPGNARVSEPEGYVRDGTLRLRLSGTIDEARCLFISAQPVGVLP